MAGGGLRTGKPEEISSDRGSPARLRQNHAPTQLNRPPITGLHELARRPLSAANEDVWRTAHVSRWQAWTR